MGSAVAIDVAAGHAHAAGQRRVEGIEARAGQCRGPTEPGQRALELDDLAVDPVELEVGGGPGVGEGAEGDGGGQGGLQQVHGVLLVDGVVG
ncbi:MAG TPA: hypothetical protein PLC94_06420, partial [bacterium]|nr:hypothetical protein [bacterium]